MNKYLIIINPVSGSGRGKKSVKIIDSFFSERKLDYKIITTEFNLHATKIVKENIDNFDVIICAGGDGTVNEIINGFNFSPNKIFAVLPIGSGNDYASNLNLCKNILENLKIITKSDRKIITSDVLLIRYYQNNVWKEKFAINAVGIGFDALVAYNNQNNKKFSGIISYIFAVFGALKELKPIYFNLSLNNKEIREELIVITVGNGKTSGGGFYLNPRAEINDGILNITTIKNINKMKLLKELPKALLNKLEDVSEASFYTSKIIKLSLDKPYYVHCDGEVLGNAISELQIEIYDQKLNTITN